MKALWAVVAIVAPFFVALFFTMNSPQFPYVVMEPSVRRDPAAIRRTYDFSHLDGSALDSALKRRLVEGFNSINQKDQVGLELGHFVLKSADGDKTFACQRYQKITMYFDGDGVATSGDLPRMEVEGSCEVGHDINKIAALWIPVSKILGETVGDGEFDFREEKPVRIRFSHVTGQWPVLWQLKAVKLDSDRGDTVFVSSDDLRQISRDPLLIEFNKR